MRKASPPAHSSSGQVLWAILIVLIALWIVAYAAHLGGGLITYLLMISLAVMAIRSAGKRRKRALVRQAEVDNERAA
jgi:lysylphosphatidylglycerol synthetase-like protein (DUF2156 family)